MSRRARGEGSVYFDTDRGRWVGASEAGINPLTGKRRRVKVIGAEGESKSAVAARLRVRVAELKEANPGAPKTVGELVELWRDRAAPKRKSEATLAMTDSLIARHIAPALGGVQIADLTVEQVEAFLDARSDLSKSTLDKLRTVLAQAFDYGIRRRHIDWNPARVAELPPGVSATREGRALLPHEARALLNVAERHRLGAWVVVAATLGLRPGEVSGIVWDAVNLDRGTLTVYQALGRANGQPVLKETKSRRSRTLELPAITSAALARHKKQQAEERLLMGERWPRQWDSLCFVSENGTPLDRSNVRRFVNQLGREAGIDGVVNPYDLRHTATSLIAAAGMSAERLADLLGHKDTRMVFDHYRHPVTSKISVAAEYWSEPGVVGAG